MKFVPGLAAAETSLRGFILNLKKIRETDYDSENSPINYDCIDEKDTLENDLETEQDKLLDAIKESHEYDLLCKIINRCSFFLATQSLGTQVSCL